jgi:hypothetical protein
MYGLPTRDERRCSADRSVMHLVQPDDGEPLRLLLVCTECGRWRVMAGTRTGEDGTRVEWVEQAAVFGREARAPAAQPA